MKRITLLSVLILLLIGCAPANTPKPYGSVPTERQLEWHKMKFYAFVHFSPNTFTDKEWGYGDESPAIFNPSELNCRQWARVAGEAGMEGIIITAKHHDGFCLWPSETTEHSVKDSPWRNGNGDVLRELREACDEYGLKLGVYLSPWDRNHKDYGTEKYIGVYRSQLRELLTNYGEIFEVWFDGAMGGDGYYGGANETRRIDNTVYYDWENTWKIVRELQPMAIMFSDGGPDVRWVGNENGYASEINWCTVKKGILYPGIPGMNKQLQTGYEDGELWIPTEVNTSIRPGWFYHKDQDDKVKSVDRLIDNWYHSVGMNGNFLLNLPVDRRGLVHENDITSLQGLKEYIDEAFTVNHAKNAEASAENVRGNSRLYSASKAIDGDPETYWATDDDALESSIEIDLGKKTEINAVLLQEYIRLGQRVRSFSIEVFVDNGFTEAASGVTVGNRRIVRFNTVNTDRLRIKIRAKACPLISNIEVYRVPDTS